jgi:hypothetical protein
MTTPRTVLKITANSPGSEVAAETAAALAAASMVFKSSDSSYSTKLVNAAIQVRDSLKLDPNVDRSSEVPELDTLSTNVGNTCVWALFNLSIM